MLSFRATSRNLKSYNCMKHLKYIFAAAILMSGISIKAQELVIRIDDMGALHSVNAACIDTYQNGIAKSVEVLVVGPWFPESLKTHLQYIIR